MNKIKFNDYKNIRNMSFNNFNRWLSDFWKASYEEGLREGESELDNADGDQWIEFIKNTPGSDEVIDFLGSTDELYKLLLTIPGIGETLADRIMERIEGYGRKE